MKNVRIFFSKDGPAKYISHLDLNRVMLRAVGMSRLGVWHTEGFHQHAYITFALPLSLGYASVCESMDFRLTDDAADLSAIPDRLNAVLPAGIVVLRCAEAVHKPADIVSASYEITLSPMEEDEISANDLSEKLNAFLAQPAIIVPKKTKKGTKDVDLKEYLLACEIIPGDGVRLNMTLPAGGSLNINPSLFVTALSEYAGVELYAAVTRTGIYMEDGADFA